MSSDLHRRPRAQPIDALDHARPATCTAWITIPTFSPEVFPERDGGPCHQPAVLRVTTRHDGTGCGCDGWCLDPMLNGLGQTEPWTEVWLLCDGHADEYRTDYGDRSYPGVTFEDLP